MKTFLDEFKEAFEKFIKELKGQEGRILYLSNQIQVLEKEKEKWEKLNSELADKYKQLIISNETLIKEMEAKKLSVNFNLRQLEKDTKDKNEEARLFLEQIKSKNSLVSSRLEEAEKLKNEAERFRDLWKQKQDDLKRLLV